MIKGIALFDWDGVLVDSHPHGLEAIPAVAKKMGIRIPTKEEITEHWGLGIEYYIEKLWPGISFKAYDKAYEECGFRKKAIPPIAGAIETLQFFSKDHYVGLITNRDDDSLRRRIMQSGIHPDYFDYIQPIENAPAPKPDPRVFEYVLQLIRNIGIDDNPIFYVGDTVTDYYATQGTGIQFIGVLSGPTSREKFLEIGVKKENIIRSVQDLPAFWKQ